MIDCDAVFSALDALVLERLGDGRFVPENEPPAWCEEVAPEAIRRGSPFVVTDVFPFFELFLPVAEAMWKAGAPSRLDSDGFTQNRRDGNGIHLVGTALRVGTRALLVVNVNERLFNEQRMVLQRARELRFAHDALAREMEQKDVLAHCVVHDLRNPLNAMSGALALIAASPPDPPNAAFTKLVEIAQRAAHRQEELIRDVLATFAATHGAESGAPATGPSWSDIGSIARQVAAALDPTARARGIAIEARVDDGQASAALPDRDAHAEVAADELRLYRVLGNLVENALRYSPAGGTISILARVEADEVFVAVDDEGKGVPASLIPHLFEKFARANDGTPGTGLGLYFCRITVEAWGGRIGYERRPVRGSRFWFRLPKRQDDDAASSRAVARAGTPPRPGPPPRAPSRD